MGIRWSYAAAVAALASALCGCAPVKVTDIAKDKQGYMARTFAPADLPHGTRDQFASLGTVKLPFRSMTLAMGVDIHKTDPGSAVTADLHETATVQVLNAGDGYTQSIVETSNNGIPVYLVLDLSYLNLLYISGQSMTYGYQRAGDISSWDKITRVDPGFLAPKENSTYEADQVAQSKTYQFTCSSGDYVSANTVYADLKGRALELSCTSMAEGVVINRQKEFFLEQYGIYMVTERTQANAIYTFKVTSVSEE